MGNVKDIEYAEWLDEWHHDAVHFMLMQGLEFMDRWATFRKEQIAQREQGIDTGKPQKTVQVAPNVWAVGS